MQATFVMHVLRKTCKTQKNNLTSFLIYIYLSVAFTRFLAISQTDCKNVLVPLIMPYRGRFSSINE